MSASSLYTYNVIIEKLKLFADYHLLIRKFSHGQITEADLQKEDEFPFMHVIPEQIAVDSGQLTYTLQIVMADLPRDKEQKTEYQRHAISDCVLLFSDLVNELENGTLFDESVIITKPITFTPFVEEFSNVLTGVQGTIEITVDYEWNACDIPYIGNIPEGSSWTPSPSGGLIVNWGSIQGTLSDQTDLQTALDAKMNIATYDTDVDGVVDSAERIQIVVRNSTGSTLTKGQIVYLSGATGNRPNAVLAQANTEATSSKTIGMVIADIPNNTDGQIAVNGTLHDLNTNAFNAGDSLWLSATTAGGMIANTPPAEPNHAVFIGYIARSHPNQGRIVLAIQNGYELDELHGVKITSVANNDILKYNSSTGLWVNDILNKSSVGLSNVDNTSDVNKPISTATQTALNAKLTNQILIFGFATNIAASTILWPVLGLSGNSNESAGAIIVPHAMTLANMTLNHPLTQQPATGAQVITIRKNSVDTAMVITIAAGAMPTTTPYQYTASTIAFSANDVMHIRRRNFATATGGFIGSITFSVQA